MKSKLKITCLFLIPLFFYNVNAQDLKPARHIFKFSPLHFIKNTFQVGYEHLNAKLNRSWNVSLGFAGNRGNGVIWNYDHKIYDTHFFDIELGFSVETQFRFYASGFSKNLNKHENRIQHGTYLAPFLKIEYCQLHGGTYTQYSAYRPAFFTLYPGVLIGYQKVFFNKVSMDLFIGGGVRYTSLDNTVYYYNPQINSSIYEGVLPKLGLNIGIAL